MKLQDMKQLLHFWKDIEDEYSYNNIIDLQKQSYIPFIGSGMSVPFGYTDWSGFLSSVINEYYDQGEKTRAEFDKLLAQGEHLALAEKINTILNGGITEEVRKRFHSDKMNFPPIEKNYLHLLRNAGKKTFITTNFDSVIEQNIKIPAENIYLPSNLQKSGDVVEAIRTDRGGLIKLHGTWDKPESIILTEADFENAYSSENTALIETVDYLWNFSVFLFLGCGLKKRSEEHTSELQSPR